MTCPICTATIPPNAPVCEMCGGMKAWTVTTPDEGRSFVVFADTRGKARANGARDEGMYDFTEYSVKRSPAFDKFSSQGIVPIEALLEAGWWVECDGCERHLHQDCITDGSAVMIDGYAYCLKCAEKQRSKKAVQK